MTRIVGGALLLTLEQGLDDAFTPATREDWSGMYGGVSRTMTEAARVPADAEA